MGWKAEQLLTIEQFQMTLNEAIETHYNRRVHGTTKRAPSEHWERCVGALGQRDVLLRGVGTDGKLALLLTHPGVKLKEMGFTFLRGSYHIAGRHDVPNGAEVIVHFDPAKLDLVHVSVQGMGNSLVYVGHARRIDASNPAPDFVEASRLESQHIREREADRQARAESRTFYAAKSQSALPAIREGAGLVASPADAVAGSTLALPAPTAELPYAPIITVDSSADGGGADVSVPGDESYWD
jgi:hypothetical protein